MADIGWRAGPRNVESARANLRSLDRASLRQKGVITIPQNIRRQLNLEEGDELIFTVEDGHIVLTPAAIIPRDQAWFWTPEWQAKEAAADAEIASGDGETYESDAEFLGSFLPS